MNDTIRLLGMEFYAYHGADPGERELGQRFEVDLELHGDWRAAGATDDLAQAVNYRDVYFAVAAAMEPACLLLEALAERIAARVLADFAPAAVTVRVRKPSVPMGGILRCAEVEIRRDGGR